MKIKILLLVLILGGCSPEISRIRQNPEHFEYYQGYVLHYNSRGRMTVLTDSDLRILNIDSLTEYNKRHKIPEDRF